VNAADAALVDAIVNSKGGATGGGTTPRGTARK